MFTLTGSKNSKIVEMGHDRLPMHGRGCCYSRQDADILFRKLVIDDIAVLTWLYYIVYVYFNRI